MKKISHASKSPLKENKKGKEINNMGSRKKKITQIKKIKIVSIGRSGTTISLNDGPPLQGVRAIEFKHNAENDIPEATITFCISS